MEGIRNLDHHGNRLFRHPECIVRGRLIRFPRWSKSCIPWLFHQIRYLYHTSLSVCLSATAKYCSSILEGYRSKQDRRYWRPANILGECVIWMITLVITPSLCYFPVVEPLEHWLDCLSGASAVAYYSLNCLIVTPHLYCIPITFKTLFCTAGVIIKCSRGV